MTKIERLDFEQSRPQGGPQRANFSLTPYPYVYYRPTQSDQIWRDKPSLSYGVNYVIDCLPHTPAITDLWLLYNGVQLRHRHLKDCSNLILFRQAFNVL